MRGIQNSTAAAGGNSASSQAVQQRIRDEFGELSDDAATAKTVNLLDLIDDGNAVNSDDDGIKRQFNPHRIGSPEWLSWGKQTGVWVNGTSVNEALAVSDGWGDEDVQNVIRGLKAFASLMQGFQDEMVRMVASGATDDELRMFAQTALSTGNRTPQHSDLQAGVDAETAKYLPGILYHMVANQDPSRMKDLFNDFDTTDLAGPSRIHSAEFGIGAMNWASRFKEARDTAGIEKFDGTSRRDSVHSEAMQKWHKLTGDIRGLSPENQKAAFDLMQQELTKALEQANQSLEELAPSKPGYTRPTDMNWQSGSGLDEDEINKRQAWFTAAFGISASSGGNGGRTERLGEQNAEQLRNGEDPTAGGGKPNRGGGNPSPETSSK